MKSWEINMKRKLASVQEIKLLEPIPKADFVEKATLKGLKWPFVVKKGEFQVGDMCVYFEIDSILPKTTWSEFLQKTVKKPDGSSEIVWDRWIRTQKFRGQISQGLALPLYKVLPDGKYNLGEDVTDLLGITKKPDLIPKEGVLIKGKLPFFILRTKEFRLESSPEVLQKYAGEMIYITEKLNGESVTFAHNDGEFYICSRRTEIKQDVESRFTEIEQKYKIKRILQSEPDNIAIQGELIGPKICKNQYKLEEYQYYIFNIYDIDKQNYWDLERVLVFTKHHKLPFVPIIKRSIPLSDNFDETMQLARDKSRIAKNVMREGIVIRTVKEQVDEVFGRVSFKIVDPKQLLKHNKK